MSYVHPAWVERQRKYWMRHDAARFIRPDAYRFMPPGAPRWLGKDAVRYFWPENQTQPARTSDGVRAQTGGDLTASARDDDHAQKLAAWQADISRLRREVATIAAELKFRRFFRSLKAGFNPSQSRVPRGNPDGGQWTSEGGGGGGRNDPRVLSDVTPDDEWRPGAQYAQNRARGGSGRGEPPTPGQAARLAVAQARAKEAIARVREADPTWRPSPSMYQSVEGEIRAYEAEAQQAEARFLELQRNGIGPGPFAHDSIPARGPERSYRREEIEQITRMVRLGAAIPVVLLILAHDPATTS
jgi:hypothetical protein